MSDNAILSDYFGNPFHPLDMRIEKDGFYLQNGKLSGMLPKL